MAFQVAGNGIFQVNVGGFDGQPDKLLQAVFADGLFFQVQFSKCKTRTFSLIWCFKFFKDFCFPFYRQWPIDLLVSNWFQVTQPKIHAFHLPAGDCNFFFDQCFSLLCADICCCDLTNQMFLYHRKILHIYPVR